MMPASIAAGHLHVVPAVLRPCTFSSTNPNTPPLPDSSDLCPSRAGLARRGQRSALTHHRKHPPLALPGGARGGKRGWGGAGPGAHARPAAGAAAGEPQHGPPGLRARHDAAAEPRRAAGQHAAAAERCAGPGCVHTPSTVGCQACPGWGRHLAGPPASKPTRAVGRYSRTPPVLAPDSLPPLVPAARSRAAADSRLRSSYDADYNNYHKAPQQLAPQVGGGAPAAPAGLRASLPRPCMARGSRQRPAARLLPWSLAALSLPAMQSCFSRPEMGAPDPPLHAVVPSAGGLQCLPLRRTPPGGQADTAGQGGAAV